MDEFGFICVKWFGLVKVNNLCIIFFKILLFSLGLNFSLQSKSWFKAEHYIHCVTHHGHPPTTHQTLFQGSRPSRRLISGIWTSQRSNNKMARFATLLPSPTKKYPKQSQKQSLFQAEHFRPQSCFSFVLLTPSLSK